MVISCLSFLLFSNAASVRKDKSILYSRFVGLVLFISILLIINDFSFNNLNKNISLFGGLYNVTYLTHVFHIFVLLLGFNTILLTCFHYRKVLTDTNVLDPLVYTTININNNKILNKTSRQFRILEYPLIILFIIIGNLLVISTNDLISLFISIELQSYGLYILCAIYRNSETGTRGGLTYFLLGGLSSCFILLGSGVLYVNSGTTFIGGLYLLTNTPFSLLTTQDLYESYYIYMSLLTIFVGLLFKLSASPFHF